MAFDKFAAVDDVTYQLPDVVRSRYVANLNDSNSAEGAALRTRIAATNITSAYGGVPTGAILPYTGTTAPAGYLICDGAPYSRTTYAALWNVLRNGTTSSPFGNGDGTTTFNVPNMQTEAPVGKAASGTFATLGASSGTETVAVEARHLPTHTHAGNTPSGGSHRHWASDADWDDGNWTGTTGNGQYHGMFADAGGYSENDPNKSVGRYTAYSDYGGNTHTHTYTTNTDGGNGTAPTHNNLQPYLVLNFIIKT